MNGFAGLWIGLGLAFLGLCIESGLVKLGKYLQYMVPKTIDVNHRQVKS